MGYQEPKARDLLELVGRVSAYASTAVSTAALLEFAVAEVARAAGFAVGHAYRLDGGAMVATSEAWWAREPAGTSPDMTPMREMSESTIFPAGVGLPGQAWGRAEPTWYTDLTDSAVEGELARREVALACGLKSAFAFPTLTGRRVDAVLEFFADTPRHADPRLIEACTTIGLAIGQVFDRIDAHQGQRAVQTHAQLILDNAGDAFVAIDGDGIVISWNRAAERMFGYESAEAVGRFMPDLIMPHEYRAAHDAGIAQYKDSGRGRVRDQYVELEAVRKGGEKFPVEMAFWGLEQQGRWQFYSFARDITERKAREADLVYRSVHDELTGLPNRRAAMEHLTAALDRRSQHGGEIAVLLMDLDRFRITKERLGHETVDALLVVVAERVRAVVGDDGWLARAADDEFLIICVQESGAHTAVDLARRAQGAFNEPVQIKDDQVSISASIGIVLASADGDTADTLLRDAGAGLSVDRESMRGAVKVFDRGGRSKIHRRLSTERDLAVAIDAGQLRLHYQPVVDFADGRIVGVEALIRWQHPRRGLLAPGSFIDVAEESGLIVPIGNWVITEACRQAAEWHQQGVLGLSVAVNLSARQFTQSTLVSDIVQSVHDAVLDPAQTEMIFEVTESSLMHDPVEAAATLAALRDEGFGISLDDFGTGYSSLAYLKSFAVDTVKIDRSFVRDIATDPRDRAIVAAVTGLGHALGLTVLAEGIETDAQRTSLADLGCDLAQGFHFGRPMPASEIMALVG